MAVATALGATGCASAKPQQIEPIDEPIPEEQAPTVEPVEVDAAKTAPKDEVVDSETDEVTDDGVEPDDETKKGWNAGGARG